MALRVLSAGYEVVVRDVVPEAVSALVEAGARSADSPRRVAEVSDVIIAMLPGLSETESVSLEPQGIAEGIRPGAVLVDMSTSSPALSRKIASEMESRGAAFLDCPVSGGIVGAERGDLTLIVGGKPEALESCRDVLSSMAGAIYHLGDVGAGNVGKLMNQVLLMTQAVLGLEVLSTAARSGIDLPTLHDLVRKSTGNSWCWENRISIALGADIKTGAFDIWAKDMKLGTALGREAGVPLFVADAAFHVLQMAKGMSTGKEDAMVAIARLYEETLGVQFHR